MSPIAKSMAVSTPAVRAFSRVARIACGSRSLPWMQGRSDARPRASRSSASTHRPRHASTSKPSQRVGNASPCRCRPGATSATISAPSINRVPLPHIGSSRSPPSACTCGQPPRISTAAATFSFSGASPCNLRQPRRCIGPPPRSIDRIARPLRITRLMRTSGVSTSTSGRVPVLARRVSTMASFTRCAA